jgi:hypothetical protein
MVQWRGLKNKSASFLSLSLADGSANLPATSRSFAVLYCIKCGVEDADFAMAKRKERGHPILCASCRAKPAKTVRTKYGVCKPWHGDFDADDNPLDEFGKPYRAGKRLCGNRDCVNEEHIETTVTPEVMVQRMLADPQTNGDKILLFLAALHEAKNFRKKNNG